MLIPFNASQNTWEEARQEVWLQVRQGKHVSGRDTDHNQQPMKL